VLGRIQFVEALFLTVFSLVSCRPSVPEGPSEAITLMTKYNNAGRHDDAIRLAQDWLKEHPDDTSHAALFYEQIALTYLTKASKDSAHKDEWIQQAVSYFDKDLSVHQKTDVDIELNIVGRGFELAGDLSATNGCVYYGRAVKDLEEEEPFIQGDSYTAYGNTIALAPIRQDNEKALERVKEKFAKAGCK